MLSAIEALCAETHNYFETDKVVGDYKIENGNITLPFLSDKQFFRIVGSKFNDSVYIYLEGGFIVKNAKWLELETSDMDWNDIREQYWGDLAGQELIDEEFHGAIWPMNMPRAFIKLAKQVKEYNESDMAKPTPYISESFGGYSYSKGIGSTGNADNSWQKVFGSQLRRWRKAANIC